ncbi:MAG: PRC-barrel domain-containing protein [Bacteroidales bacterium]
MKHASLFAAALVLAVPFAATAQERQQGQPAQSQQGQQSEQRAQLSSDAHHVIDKKAVNAQGKDIGKIKDVLIGQDGRVQALVVDVKGKSRAVPWTDVSMKADQLTVNMSDQQLSQLPEYRGEHD